MKNVITIHRLDKDKSIFEIVPLKVKRDWMSNSKEKFAYKCLPLNIANQYGWAVLSPIDFTIIWKEGTDAKDISIETKDPEFNKKIMSYFGESIFTLHPDFIVQTPKNYSLYVRGIPNGQRSGIIPLDALVETDWLPFMFSYNFKINVPGTYLFKKGEPLFSFFPVERNTVETFALVDAFIEDSPELFEDYKELKQHATDRRADDFYHRLYFKGKTPSKTFEIENHTTKISFREMCTRPKD